MLPDLQKILAADHQGQETVAQASQEALALKRQTDARVQELQAQLQDELDQLRQGVQTEILQEADLRTQEIAAATDRQVQELNRNSQARQGQAVDVLVARVLGT
jgi:vacuolar-type H+-ATPase subunit H